MCSGLVDPVECLNTFTRVVMSRCHPGVIRVIQIEEYMYVECVPGAHGSNGSRKYVENYGSESFCIASVTFT